MARSYLHIGHYHLQYKCPHEKGLKTTTTTVVKGVNLSQDSVVFSFQCIDTKVSAPVVPANCSRPYLCGVLIMETITSLLELGSGHLRLEDVNNCVLYT